MTANERKTYVFAGIIAIVTAIAMLTGNLDGLVAAATAAAGIIGTLFLRPVTG